MKFKFVPHIAIQVKKASEAIRFYRDVMGMEIVKERESETQLQAGDASFYVEDDPRGLVFFAFEVEDLKAARLKLEEAGCEIYDESASGFMVRDPYGLKFYLSRQEDQIATEGAESSGS